MGKLVCSECKKKAKWYCPVLKSPLCSRCCAKLRSGKFECSDECIHWIQVKDYKTKQVMSWRKKLLQSLDAENCNLFFQKNLTLTLFEYVLYMTLRQLDDLPYQDFKEGMLLTQDYLNAAKSSIIWEPESVNPLANSFFNKLKTGNKHFNEIRSIFTNELNQELKPEDMLQFIGFELKAYSFFKDHQPNAPTYFEQLSFYINGVLPKSKENEEIANMLLGPEEGGLLIK